MDDMRERDEAQRGREEVGRGVRWRRGGELKGEFVCLLVYCYKTRKSLLRLPPCAQNPWEHIFSGHVALAGPVVLLKVHHSPDTLCVNTVQVDGLARIPRLIQALYKSHPQPQNSALRYPTSDPLKY